MTTTTHTTENRTETRTRTAIVTGGSGGIGRAVAERLGADGANVLVHYSGNAGRADETAAAIRAAGGDAVTMRADVAQAVLNLIDSRWVNGQVVYVNGGIA